MGKVHLSITKIIPYSEKLSQNMHIQKFADKLSRRLCSEIHKSFHLQVPAIQYYSLENHPLYCVLVVH